MSEHSANGGNPLDSVSSDSSSDASSVGTGLAPVLQSSVMHSPTLHSPAQHPSPPQANLDLHLFLDGLHQLGLELSEQQSKQFLQYQQELLDWNTRINLTSITNPGEVFTKHFLDSLSLLMVYDTPTARILDIGAGAGFPGLPLKIVRPQWHVVLIEATGKKVKFLQHIIETLQLHHIEAVQGRAEELAHKAEYRAFFDIVTARAVASLPILLEYASPFCRVGGQMVFHKKGDLTAELAQGKRAASQVGARLKASISVTLPGLDDGRRLIAWEQIRKCPEQFPRSNSVIAKKPLG